MNPDAMITTLKAMILHGMADAIHILSDQSWLDRLTHHCHILETGNDSYRLKHSTTNQEEEKDSKNQKTTL